MSWVNHLPEVLNWYNKVHVHRTVGMTPEQASLADNQTKLKQRYVEIRSEKLPESKPLGVGIFCRIYRWKSSRFAKGSEKNWSSEIFRIKEVLNTNPITYRVEDETGEVIKGSFYRAELLPSAFSF